MRSADSLKWHASVALAAADGDRFTQRGLTTREIRRAFEAPDFPTATSWSADELGAASCTTGSCGGSRAVSTDPEGSGTRGGSGGVLGALDRIDPGDDPRDGPGGSVGADRDHLPSLTVSPGDVITSATDRLADLEDAWDWFDEPPWERVPPGLVGRWDEAGCFPWMDCYPADEYDADDYLPIPDENGSDCSFVEDPSNCEHPRLDHRSTTTPCTILGYRALVDVNACEESAENLIRDAWCLLAENADIVEWATCLMFSASARARIIDHVLANYDSVFDMRTTVKCSSAVGGISGPCNADGTFAARSFWGAFGGWIHLCETHESFPRALDAFASFYAPTRLFAVIWFASLLAHELTHVAFAFDSADYEKQECESSYLLESIVFYALMQRYSLAELSPCAEAYWASFDGEEPFMNNAGTNRFPEDCA